PREAGRPRARSGEARRPGWCQWAADWVGTTAWAQWRPPPLEQAASPRRPAFFAPGLRDNNGMASPSFDFERASRVTAGAVGPPGKRTFYLQVRQGAEIMSLALEKEQLRLLAVRLQEILANVQARPEMQAADMALQEPLVEAWAVGAMPLALH